MSLGQWRRLTRNLKVVRPDFVGGRGERERYGIAVIQSSAIGGDRKFAVELPVTQRGVTRVAVELYPGQIQHHNDAKNQCRIAHQGHAVFEMRRVFANEIAILRGTSDASAHFCV